MIVIVDSLHPLVHADGAALWLLAHPPSPRRSTQMNHTHAARESRESQLRVNYSFIHHNFIPAIVLLWRIRASRRKELFPERLVPFPPNTYARQAPWASCGNRVTS